MFRKYWEKTSLHISTGRGFSDLSQLFIDSAGCDVNARNSRGETPFYSAVRAKNVTDVEVLLNFLRM